MIADRNTGVERISTLQGKKIEMGLATSREAVAMMMRSMIDLYKDQELACIREYSTNASDAHIEAGQTRPIEVELPGPLSPFLTIRDFGVGMSADDIEEVYSKYGASTKRGSNDVQGMLGYGCKAALSYTPQFTVMSVKDGVRTQMAVSREADGSGSMTLVDVRETDKPNGTEIQIPVRSDNKFEEKARLFFSFWEVGSVLVNGKAPERVKGLAIGDNMLVYKGEANSYGYMSDAPSYVVMGKVAYPATFRDVNLNRGYGIIAWVGMADVNFTPSREALMEQDKTTMDTLVRISREFNTLAPAAIQTQIDKARTPAEALETLCEYKRMIPNAGRATYQFKGNALPTSFRFAQGTMMSTRRSHAMGSCTQVWDYEADLWHKTLWMEGHTGEKYTATHKRKILQWLGENGMDHLEHFVQSPTVIPQDVKRYVNPQYVIDWQTIKDVKLPQAASSGYSGYSVKTIKGSFDVWIDGEWKGEYAANSIDQQKPIYYMHGNRAQCSQHQELLANRAQATGCTFVCVPGNRVEKFKRDFPKAIEAHKAVEGMWEAWKKSLGGDTLAAMAMDDAGQTSVFKGLDMLRVKDPAIKRAIRLAKIDLTRAQRERRLFRYVMRTMHSLELPHFNNPLKKYPLLADRYGHPKGLHEHTYLYINAAYEADKKGA